MDDDPVIVASTAGKPLKGVEIRIVDSQGRECLPGVRGEVFVRGDNVMVGYFDDEVATREAIDGEGFLHTGDIGVMDERGYLRITDRLKDMFIVGGFNCYPAEIENLLSNMPGVAQASVIGVPDERLGEVAKAFIVGKADAGLTENSVIEWCRERIANFKVPRSVEFLDSLPLNESNKVLKNELRARASAGR
jgi:acyl-CoA synthetase (AMP-forming)/AMP-acid ligase II